MRGNTRIGLVMLALALVTVLVYLPALRNGFVNWDDNTYVTENLLIQHLDVPFFKTVFTKYIALNYHPLTLISHAMDYALWGMNPLGHHLTSVLLHGLNAALVFLFFITLFPPSPGPAWQTKHFQAALLTALLFGIHPVHTESVAWISERKDVLYSALYLLSLLAYVRYARSTVRPIRYYLLSLAAFLLSLLSKPMAVSLPLVLLLLDAYPLERLRWRGWRDRGLQRVLLEKAPFCALAISFSVATLQSQQQSMVHISLLTRLVNIPYSLMVYLAKLFAPLNLAPYYPYPHPLLSRVVISPLLLTASTIAVAAITAACLWYRRTRPGLFLAWAACVVQLLPVLGIVQVGQQLTADRYAYLSTVPIVYLLAVTLTGWAGKRSLHHQAGIALVTLVAAGFLVLKTQTQISLWKDSLTLWNHEIHLFRDLAALPYYNRGCTFLKLGNTGLALQDFNKTLELDPQHGQAYGNRGYVHVLTKQYAQALPDFNRAVELEPASSTAFGNRGTLLSILGKPEAAIRDLSRAIALDQANSKALRSRGWASIELRDYRQALADFSRAIAIDAGYAEAFLGRGQAREALGDMSGALTDYSRALELAPGSSQARAGLGSVSMKMGQADKAAMYRPGAGQRK